MIPPAPIPSPPPPLNRRLTGATLILVGAFGALLAGILALQLDRLADRQTDALGTALVAQLAEAAGPPLWQQDPIALQVALASVANLSASIARVSVFDVNDQLHAQRPGRSTAQGALASFRRRVTLGDAVAGAVQVELHVDELRDGYRQTLALALGAWLLVGGGFAWWLSSFGRSLSARLQGLGAGLPGADTLAEGDEITALERRLAPLLVHARPPPADPPPASATLALHCRNFARLQSLLNRESHERLIEELDAAVERVCRLYEADRLPGSEQWILLRFDPLATSAAAGLRALRCAHALLYLLRAGATTGARPELSAVVAEFVPADGTLTLRDLAEYRHLRALESLSAHAQPGQVLIASALWEKSAWADEIVVEAVADAPQVRLVRGFADAQQALFERQLAYLSDWA